MKDKSLVLILLWSSPSLNMGSAVVGLLLSWFVKAEMPMFRGLRFLECVSKKTSFSKNWPWQILLMTMRNPPYFFLTIGGDSYIYKLDGLHIRHWQRDIFSPPVTVSFYISKCPAPEKKPAPLNRRRLWRIRTVMTKGKKVVPE